MHIPSLVKIHWYLLKLSSGNEKLTDNGRMDGRTQGRPTWNQPFFVAIVWQGIKILNLHVATMPPTKFQLNPTYGSGDAENVKS